MSNTHHHGDRKKKAFTPWLWMTTPGYWIRMMMTRPQRRQASVWQRGAEKTAVDDLEQLSDPPQGRKPHHYFW